MNAQELMKQIRDTEKAASFNLEGVDWRSRPGHEAAQRNARNALPALKAQYEEILMKNAVAVVVNATPAKTADFAQESLGLAPIGDLAGVYRSFAAEVEPAMRTDRLFQPTQFARLAREIQLKCAELGLDTAPSLKYKDGASPKTIEDLAVYIQKLVEEIDGTKLAQVHTRKDVSLQAHRIGFDKDVLPVFFLNPSAEDMNTLTLMFKERIAKISLKNEVTKETVSKVIDQIQEKFKTR
ncbi:hypothetical protein UFOVP75_121 [uncultured Caudovirales phage]|uniref:Uncharacterized protein n=1 Tax=uncultured Caudovirales phage TaxID=2100421 RepID=A0A6J5L209_9CAUD|nr:hypothetical protein UFOVP75_121 [uncultured Caudovirales phage]